MLIGPAQSELKRPGIVVFLWKTKDVYFHTLAFFVHLCRHKICDDTLFLIDLGHDLVIEAIELFPYLLSTGVLKLRIYGAVVGVAERNELLQVIFSPGSKHLLFSCREAARVE